MMQRGHASLSPRLEARIAGFFYLITFATGVFALYGASGRLAANLIADGCYLAVTVLFYDLFKPVDRNVSRLAALFSLAGCALGIANALAVRPLGFNPLVFFGVYCLLIGYLIFRSSFLPRILGVGMAAAGLGWLTFVSASLAHGVSPFNIAAGMIGEGALALWLVAVGVDEPRWVELSAMGGWDGGSR